MQVSYNVLNVKCGGCATSIQNGLKKIEGITDVQVDIPTGKVSVEGNELDENLIKQILSELGYPVDDTMDLLSKAKDLLS